MRNLQDWLSYLETQHPNSIDLGLDRIREVALRLNVLTFPCPVITVAGTNGKGSCVATLESIYRAGGYRVASYTSPHMLRFNERIKINQQPVSDAQLCAAFSRIEEVRGNITLTYFELTTLAALLIFQRNSLDIIILEVGMGGRLDAVNLIDPDISIITSIALDHTEWLGDTREAIGFEKAGIFRENIPVVCGETDPPQTLCAQAEKLAAPFFLVGKDFSYDIAADNWSWRNQQITLNHLPNGKLWIPNMATALQAVMLMQPQLPVLDEAIIEGIDNARVAGRFQRIAVQPEVILDVAHNPAGAQHLAQRLQETVVMGNTICVFSMLQDKDIHASIQALTSVVDHWFIAPLFCPRAADVVFLREQLLANSVLPANIFDFDCISTAYHAALAHAQPVDRIVATGSFYTVASVINLGSRNQVK